MNPSNLKYETFEDKLEALEAAVRRECDDGIEQQLRQVRDMVVREKERDDALHNESIQLLKDKYESQLAMLERKIVEVQSARVAAGEAEVASKLARIKETLEAELISKFNEKNRK